MTFLFFPSPLSYGPIFRFLFLYTFGNTVYANHSVYPLHVRGNNIANDAS